MSFKEESIGRKHKKDQKNGIGKGKQKTTRSMQENI
jgi:hypothetical protein